MGAAMDNAEEAMLQLIDDPGLLRDPSFTIFTLQRWPCLEEHYRNRSEKIKGSKRVADLEFERLYQCDDNVEALVDKIVVCSATGILKALYHNAHNFLTSCDGKYAYENWESDMIESTKHCVADNILLAESFLGRVDYYWRRGLNFYMSTVSGLVMAKHGNLFDNTPIFWKDVHSEACIAMTKKYHTRFMSDEKEQMRQQELAYAEMLRDKELKAEAKLLRQSLTQISYFTIPTLRTIKKPQHLDEALATLNSMTKKIDLLKMFISMYAFGFGIDVPIKFSSSKDKTVGTFDDLLRRAKHILAQKFVIPVSPPLRKVAQTSSPLDFGLTLLEEYSECSEKYEVQAGDQISKVLELDRDYGIKLLYDWNSIHRQYWDVPLTNLQKEFKRDRIFREDGVLYKVIGLSWDTVRNEYAAYYYVYESSKTPPTRVNDLSNRVEHSFFVSIPDIYIGINEWDIEWII
jgi:hypothetical protein